jgi:hypothetical protein
MANIAVTYTFSASQKADANNLYQNFVDIVNGLSDGTKNLSVTNATCVGTASATFVSFPAASPTVASAVYSGYAQATYNAALNTYSGNADEDLVISGTGTVVGDAIITLGSSPLKVTAVKKSIVTIHWTFTADEFDVGPYFYLNGTTEIQRARDETYANLRKCSTSVFLDVGHYITFRSSSNASVSTSISYLSISAIQVG